MINIVCTRCRTQFHWAHTDHEFIDPIGHCLPAKAPCVACARFIAKANGTYKADDQREQRAWPNAGRDRMNPRPRRARRPRGYRREVWR